MNHHRIQRIFDLMCDAGSDASEIRQPLGVVELGFKFSDRLAVMQRDERTDGFSTIFNRLNRGFDGKV
jgi:hypothetical protein